MELYALRDISGADDPNLQEVEIYYLKGLLQKGKSCTRLLRASSSDSDESVAIKLFPKKNGECSPGYITEEGSVTKLSHPNLLKYHTFYKDAIIKGKNGDFCEYSAIVMQYISHGDLFKLVSNSPLTEKVARTLFKQMISVIEYLHEQNLTHLDIKLENFLVTDDGIKLIDFEDCQDLKKRQNVSLPAGTSGYRPPEFVTGGYQDLKSADLYSLGVVLFTMVSGTPPYTELEDSSKTKTHKFDQYYETLRKNTKKFWEVHEHYRTDEHKECFTQDFKTLVEGMLAENPRERLTLDKIKRSEWFKGDVYSEEDLTRELRQG